MTNTHLSCPDFTQFLQYLDRELPSDQEAQFADHLTTCESCRTQLQTIQQMEERITRVLSTASVNNTAALATPHCLTPELLSAYVQRVLLDKEMGQVETHLQTCDWCVQAVMEATFIPQKLNVSQHTVPLSLKNRVVATLPSAQKPRAASLSRLVVGIAQQGLQLLEQHLVAPFLNVQATLMLTPAYRATEAPSVLDLRIQTEPAEIHATVFQEGNGLSLTMTFVSPTKEALAGQRIFIRREGRSIFSARTDPEGVLRTPHLAPGIYEVACSELDASFQLELHG